MPSPVVEKSQHIMLFQLWTGITLLTTRTHPQPLPLVNGGESEIPKLVCHSCARRNPRHNPTRQKRDARLRPGAQVREHDNEKYVLFLLWTRITIITNRTHPQPLPLVNGGEKKITKLVCHSCPEQESPTQPDKTKTRCPLTPRRTSPRAWQWKNACLFVYPTQLKDFTSLFEEGCPIYRDGRWPKVG